MTLVLAAGAFVALERGSREMARRLKMARLEGDVPISHGGVISQVWRGGAGRQAGLAKALQGVRIAPLDDKLGRRAGVLLGRAGMRDAVDAAVVALARDDDAILTSDRDDISALVTAYGTRVDIVPV